MATLTYKNLEAGVKPIVTDTATILTGNNLTAGSLLGKITKGAGTGAAGTNTGNGTFTPDSTTPILTKSIVGAYRITCKQAVTNGGIFEVANPDGICLGLYKVGDTWSNQIKFVIADGGTDFAVGDFFTYTIAAGSGKCKLSNSVATDGSEIPYAVLLEDIDASSADKTAPVGLEGEFNSNFMTFGGSDTAATRKDALRAIGIYLKTGVAA